MLFCTKNKIDEKRCKRKVGVEKLCNKLLKFSKMTCFSLAQKPAKLTVGPSTHAVYSEKEEKKQKEEKEEGEKVSDNEYRDVTN